MTLLSRRDALKSFSLAVGATALSGHLAPAAAERQEHWRFCGQCFGMFYWGYPDKGVCPVKGAHDAIGFNFHIPHDIAPTWTSQGEWRFCEKCKGLFFDGYNIKGVCPADRPGGHRAAGFNFVIPHDVASTETSQRDWRYCNNCYGMFFDGYPKKGVCPANGGSHLPMGFNFVIPHARPAPAPQPDPPKATPPGDTSRCCFMPRARPDGTVDVVHTCGPQCP
jgi:hypothetical protein